MHVVCGVRLGARELNCVCGWSCAYNRIKWEWNVLFGAIQKCFFIFFLSMINVILLVLLALRLISLSLLRSHSYTTNYNHLWSEIFSCCCCCEYSITSDSVLLNALQPHSSNSNVCIYLPSFCLSSLSIVHFFFLFLNSCFECAVRLVHVYYWFYYLNSTIYMFH